MLDNRSRVTKRVQYSCENCRWVQFTATKNGRRAPKTDVDIEERKLAVRENDRHALLALDLIKVVAITMLSPHQYVRRDNSPAELW